MFPTKYREHEKFTTDPGDPVKVLYAPVFDKKGVMHLEESGRENLYDFIQSHRDSVDLHKILERFNAGDVSALDRVQGTFGDFTQMPTTYAELLNTVIDGERTFDALPLDVKQKFGMSFHRWLATAGSPDWCTAMGYETSPLPDFELKPNVPAPNEPEPRSEE